MRSHPILVAAALAAAGLALAGCKPGQGWPTIPGPTARAECDCAKGKGDLAGGPKTVEVPGPPPPLKVAQAHCPKTAVAEAPHPVAAPAPARRHPAPRSPRAASHRYAARPERVPAVHRAAGYANDRGNVYDYAAIYGARSASVVSRSSYVETYDSGWISQGSEQGYGGYVEQGYGPPPYAAGPCPVRCAY